jgi:glucosamine--fructose-6-phosphate aminotransferase (isomerizing)
MCGIIAVVRRPSDREPPAADELVGLIEPVPGRLAGLRTDELTAEAIDAVSERLESADATLRGVPGVRALLAAPDLVAAIDRLTGEIEAEVVRLDHGLDETAGPAGSELERLNAAMVRLKDAVWAIRRDRLRTASAVAAMARPGAGPAAIEAFTSIQVALSAIDRLEVRGRDSAGLHLLVTDHGLDLDTIGVRAMLEPRARDHLFRSGAVRTPEGHLSFVYKAAAEIGELGDNVRHLREAIADDELLHLALSSPTARTAVLGHTRWASVGIISEANAHPLNSDEEGRPGEPGPYVVGALNGDVDNYADLKSADALGIAADVTTDAKVIPTLVSRRLGERLDLTEAFRRTVASFEGSVAIGAQAVAAPGQLMLALRGSGQALYVGLAEDSFIVASEPYGLVEETLSYLRMDGETPANPDNPTASRGQIILLDGDRAGTLDGIRRIAYDGTELPVAEPDLTTAQITTRDIDRGAYSHFLLKEVNEAPGSVRKTLRGKLVEREGRLDVRLGPDTMPDEIADALASGALSRVIVIGQGTAAVAAQSLAAVLTDLAADTELLVSAQPATELSGFGLRADMSDTLVVAISQSGTTTDTNRTVDLVRSRGARVIAIVNRRNSDLTDKADGVLYTSDGRDVEMSVPSTKAFYAQVAAGCVLAVAIADRVGARPADREPWLAELRRLPEAMTGVLALRPEIASVAHQFAPSKRYWAVVGNGLNRIAAQELRIKLSELCYKSIAFDSTEDKKHIDLSAEPLILVCAAGLTGSTADDVAKEVAIFRAHKATPLLICTEGEDRFSSALAAIKVPATHPRLAFVLSAMAGHLFGFEAALAIDAQARPLRQARAAIESTVSSLSGNGHGVGAASDGADVLRQLVPAFEPIAARFFDGLRAGSYDGHLEASTAVRLASLLRYALGVTPLDAYQLEYGKIGTPGVVVDDLTAALTRAIEELTRPVDAIKHQAKTVTVGISRTDETLLQVPLVQSVMTTGSPRDRLTYATLRTLAAIDPAVEAVSGWIRYAIGGDSGDGDDLTISVVDRGGIARDIPSRADRNPVLSGTKHLVAIERRVYAFRGRRDGRTLVAVPEVKDGATTGITLLHVRFAGPLPVATARSVLQGYANRYAAIRDAVTEVEPVFREDILAEVPIVDLLTAPINEVVERWRT